MRKIKILVSGEEEEFNLIHSVEELPEPCRGCKYVEPFGFGIERIYCSCDSCSRNCGFNLNEVKPQYAMFPKKISEVFKAAWSKTIKYPKWFFRILWTDGKPAWEVAFEVQGVAYVYVLKGHGKGSCRRLTEWELKNRKILECSYEEAEKWSRYFESKTK